ncbi:MAG: phosphate butyryltransferase, partial [Tissierellia bacterium]|nr:phosphate butyryltransferase [Tissierellia bacterium]
MVKSFNNLLQLVQEKEPKRIAVAVPEDKQVLSAIKASKDLNIIEPILVGNEFKIVNISQEIGFNLSGVKIIDEKDKVLASRKAT